MPQDMQPANKGEVKKAATVQVTAKVAGMNTGAAAAAGMIEMAPRKKRSVNLNKIGIGVVAIAVAAGAGYLAYEKWGKAAPQEEAKPEFHPRAAGLGPVTEVSANPASEKARNRTRDLGYELSSTNALAAGGATGSEKSLYEHLQELSRRSSPMITADGLKLLGAQDPRPAGAGGSTEDGTKAAETGKPTTNVTPDVQARLEALAPDTYPPSGLQPQAYLTLLRNTLNRPRGARLDLEKAYILLSMFYDPSIDPHTYRADLNSLANELYGRLTTVDARTGQRKAITDGREQVRILTELVMNGMGPFRGWDVQEYYPGLIERGTAPVDQNYLVNKVLADGPRKRNAAAHTALNIVAVILARKLSSDIEEMPGSGGIAREPKVHLPVYGVRLPDRTILRYDMRGAYQPVPLEETAAVDTSFATKPNVKLPDATGTALSAVASDYVRNVEFLRNGNHYSGADYVARLAINPDDVQRGLYLTMLDDRQLFATLGYELAHAEVSKHTKAGYERAQLLLDSWVLDRDDGAGLKPDLSARDIPFAEHASPRGDPSLRDAYILYADMLLQQADYDGIKRQLDENLVLRSNLERLSELRGMEKAQTSALEHATAYLEDALRLNPQNARAQLYLGDIAFIMHDGSTPESVKGTPRDFLGEALKRFAQAETLDKGSLNGQERFLLHWHRAHAQRRAGHLMPALGDLDRVAEINPVFARTPAFEATRDRLKLDRAFEALRNEEGDVKFDAVEYLKANMPLKHDMRRDFMDVAALIGKTGNIAAEWELVNWMRSLSGTDIGLDRNAWTAHWKAWFDANP